jgi:hypothetical protein
VQVLSEVFEITFTAPCVADSYIADRKNIKDPKISPYLEKFKYGPIGTGDPTLFLPFGFDFLPSTCAFYKSYSISVTKKSDGSVYNKATAPVATTATSIPWLSLDTPNA